jgi:hypothetical protein
MRRLLESDSSFNLDEKMAAHDTGSRAGVHLATSAGGWILKLR